MTAAFTGRNGWKIPQVLYSSRYITNVDRTARNTNLLVWHKKLQLIDHGAALYFHHAWNAQYLQRSRDPFALIKDHVLLPFAAHLIEADATCSSRLTPEIVRDIVAAVPDAWLLQDPFFAGGDEYRKAYAEYLLKRLESRRVFVEEAVRARSLLV